jgi:hypothetical protein
MYDFDFWILPYLEGKGLSIDQIKKFVDACDDLLSLEINVPRGQPITDRVQAENKLRQICGEIGENKNVLAAH